MYTGLAYDQEYVEIKHELFNEGNCFIYPFYFRTEPLTKSCPRHSWTNKCETSKFSLLTTSCGKLTAFLIHTWHTYILH